MTNPTAQEFSVVRSVDSPDGFLRMTINLDDDGRASYDVTHRGRSVLKDSRLGVMRSDQDFFDGLELAEVTETVTREDRIELPHGKQRIVADIGNERVFRFVNRNSARLDVIVRVHNSGVAFRYHFPDTKPTVATVIAEATSFAFHSEGRSWIQPKQEVSLTAPAYENLYWADRPIAEASPGQGWNLPALFDTRGGWALVTEADLTANYFGAHLRVNGRDGEYEIALPHLDEGDGLGACEPTSELPWTMPWRVIVVSDSLAGIVQSDLVRLLSRPNKTMSTAWIRPGRVSWGWWSDHESPQDLERLYAFVDLSLEMGWEYTLVDANWTVHSEHEIRTLTSYAKKRRVGVFLWYNSGGPNNHVEEEPRNRMFDRKIRRAEMAKLAEWGVAGVKVDFFHSDKQSGIALYIAILEDAAEFKLMINFHGCTIPRGWSRTYPHLMTMEAVAGAEQYAFSPSFPEAAPVHNTILPFTRNVVGSMDYTPVTFGHQRYPHLTTSAHELALSVVFESGLLHFADSVDSYLSQPTLVREFLQTVPSVWDETLFLDGHPGKFVVLARRFDKVWYVGAISGERVARAISIDLCFLSQSSYEQLLITDANCGNELVATRSHADQETAVTIARYGGFAARFSPIS